jgi:hypothetical protein
MPTYPVDLNVQTQPFFAHVDSISATVPPAVGVTTMTPAPGIGGKAPSACGITAVPGRPTARSFFTSGAAGADWLASTIRPVLPNTGNVELAYRVVFGAAALELAEAWETDLILVIDGFHYNDSLQVNFAKGNQVQVGAWTDAGITLPAVVPDVEHLVRQTYTFDVTARTTALASYALDGAVYPVPASLVQRATPSTWEPGAYVQVQEDLAAAPGAYAVMVDGMTLTWW